MEHCVWGTQYMNVFSPVWTFDDARAEISPQNFEEMGPVFVFFVLHVKKFSPGWNTHLG